MLISLSGSQGSGKSTIISELQQKGFNVVSRKTSRSILSDWNVTLPEVNSNTELTLKFQDEIIRRKFQDEQEARDSSDIWFTERSFVDLWVYSLLALGNDNQNSEWLDKYYIQCMQLQQSYDMVYYLTAGHFSIQHDGVRGSNNHYSKMVDTVMMEFTQQMTHPSVLTVIDTPIIDQRVAIMTSQTIGMKKRLQNIKGTNDGK